MKEKKKLFLVIFVALFCLCLIRPSYSYYKITKENSNAFVLEGVELTYQLVSSDLTNNQLTVPAYAKQSITIQVSSNNTKDTNYALYYEFLTSLSTTEKSNVTVKCYEKNSIDLPTGILPFSGTKTITVEIENKNSKVVTLGFDCQGGLVGHDLVLEQGNPIELAATEISILQRSGGSGYSGQIWEHRDSTTKIVFQNQMQPIENASYTYDMSDAKDGSIMAYVVLNEDQTTHTIYIQSNASMYANPDSSYWFYHFSQLTSIEGIEYLDTSMVTNMKNMFSGCSSLLSLDLSHFNTSQVTDMSELFRDCRELVELDIRNFDTSKVTDMAQMFKECNNLTNIDFSNFNTSNVTDMFQMFMGCSSLTDLDLSSFDTAHVTRMGDMFYNCSSLVNLDLRNASFEKVATFDDMFSYTPSNIRIIAKDATNQAWLQSKLKNGGTVVIAS